jgi:excinuclease ABC subunit A
MCEMSRGMMLERYKNHDIEVVVDKLAVDSKDAKRLKQSLATALAQGDGLVMIMEMPSGKIRHYSK